MEKLSQNNAILRRTEVARALAGSQFVESMHLCGSREEGWKVAVHISPGETALKVTVAQLAELDDGNVYIYNPQRAEEPQLENLIHHPTAA